MHTTKLLARVVVQVLLVCLSLLRLVPAGATEPTVGDGSYDIFVRSTYLLPDETLGGRMSTIASYSGDHYYYKPSIDWLPPSEAQTFASVILGSSPIPTADLMLDTAFDNIPLNAGVGVSAQIRYKFVAYKKIALELPADQRVPLIMTGYVHVSSTNLMKWDTATAESLLTTDDGSNFGAAAQYRFGDNSSYVPIYEKPFVRPDFVNSVTLTVTGNIAFGWVTASEIEPLTGYKSLQAFADPTIVVDPDYLLTADGVTYRAADVYGLAFSPGFMAPEPSTLVILGTLSILGGLAYMRRSLAGQVPRA